MGAQKLLVLVLRADDTDGLVDKLQLSLVDPDSVGEVVLIRSDLFQRGLVLASLDLVFENVELHQLRKCSEFLEREGRLDNTPSGDPKYLYSKVFLSYLKVKTQK